MSHDIYFQCGARKVGHVHFSSFTDERQKRAYGGLSFSACITYGDGGGDGLEGEMIGAPDTDDLDGWYSPDWDRCLARARDLLAEAEATTIEHRREYDVPKLRELVRLLEECSKPDIRAYCRIRLSY